MLPRRGTSGLLLLVLLINSSCSSFIVRHNDHFSRVIAGAKQYFNSDCVNLVKSKEFYSISVMLREQRLLFGRWIPSAILDMSAILNNTHSLLHACNTPMFALFANNDTRRALKLLADSKNLSGKIWLVFFQNSLHDYFFLDINIPFDCELIVSTPSQDERIHLTEVYRVSARFPLQKHRLASWSPTLGFTWSSGSLYDRRRDLGGVVFRTTVNDWVPYALVRNGTVGGFFGDVWRILEGHLRFSSAHRVPDDGLFGTLLENHTWDGMMGVILRGEADMSAVGLTVTPVRADYVAFTIPLFVHNMAVYIREPNRKVSLLDLLSPLSLGLWLALVLSGVTSSLILALLYKEGTFSDTIFRVFAAIFCMQGLLVRSPALSTCMVTFLVYVIGVVFLNIYSSFVTSSLTTFRPEMPFESIEGILHDGSYSLGMLRVGYPYSAFKNAQNDKQQLLKQLFEKHISRDPKNLQRNIAEGFQRVCTVRFAFMVGEEAPATLRLNCSVVSLRSRFSEFRICFAFPRKSPYVGVFNSKLLNLMNSGILRKLSRSAVGRTAPYDDKVSKYRASLHTVKPVFTVLAAGIVASCIILVCEVAAHRNQEDIVPVRLRRVVTIRQQ